MPACHADAETVTAKRAIHEALDLLPREGFVLVRNRSHADPSAHEYTVGVDPDGSPTDCTCPDYKYRKAPDGLCKHMRRVELSEPVAEAAAATRS